MKGSSALWRMLFLVITVVITLEIIVFFLPGIGLLLDNVVKLDPTFRAMEVAAAISQTQAAPEGFFYDYGGLPRKDEPACLRIYQTFIVVGRVAFDIVQRPPTTANITLLATSQGQPNPPKSITEPIVVDCKANGVNVVFRKAGGNVTVEVLG